MFERIHDFFVARGAVVTGDVQFQPGVNIWFGCVLRGDLATISLGRCVNIQDGCILHTDFAEPLDLSDGVVLGHGAIVHGRRIGRDSLIGIGARLLTGCDIGEECLVAAGSIVTENKKIPPRSVVMGIPAKVVREIRPDEIERTRSICAHYRERAECYSKGEFRAPWLSAAPQSDSKIQ